VREEKTEVDRYPTSTGVEPGFAHTSSSIEVSGRRLFVKINPVTSLMKTVRRGG